MRAARGRKEGGKTPWLCSETGFDHSEPQFQSSSATLNCKINTTGLEKTSAGFSPYQLFSVFFPDFFPLGNVVSALSTCVILGVPDVSPSAGPAPGLLKFWRSHDFPLEEPAAFSSWRSTRDLGKVTDSEFRGKRGCAQSLGG